MKPQSRTQVDKISEGGVEIAAITLDRQMSRVRSESRK